jgi:hypothetical protein
MWLVTRVREGKVDAVMRERGRMESCATMIDGF